MTYAVVQAAVVLLAIRALDPFSRQPFGVVALVALWGATGAAILALIGNEAVRSLLSGDARTVFGDALSAPVVEEVAKGLAIVGVVVASRWALERMGISLFGGVTDGVVYGAAVGLGFEFTRTSSSSSIVPGTRASSRAPSCFSRGAISFGPAMLHHTLFSAAFGAGIGLAVWATRPVVKAAFVTVGLLVAILMHAVNNGFVELWVVARHGLGTAADWVNGADVGPDVHGVPLTRPLRSCR